MPSALVAKLRRQPGVRDAEALAAWISRYKKLRKAGVSNKKAMKLAGKEGGMKEGGVKAEDRKTGGGKKKEESATQKPALEVDKYDGSGKIPLYKGKPGPLTNKPHDVREVNFGGGKDLMFSAVQDDPMDDVQIDMKLGGPAISRDIGTFEPGEGLRISSALKVSPELNGKLKDAYGGEVEGYHQGENFIPFDAASVKDRPVKEVVKVPGGKRMAPMSDALDAIGRVHTDGVLPKIETKPSTARGYYGQYSHRGRHPEAIRLNTTPTSDHPRLTSAHELGHFLDHQGLGDPDAFGSDRATHPNETIRGKAPAPMAKLMDSIDKSPPIGKLKDMRENPDKYAVPIEGMNYSYKPDARHIDYLSSPKERFARAYSQWIALRSKDPEMRRELDVVRDRESKAKLPYPDQWTDEEFEPIAAAFDDMFREMGWLKNG